MRLLLFFVFAAAVEAAVCPANIKQEKLGKTRWDWGSTTITNEARLDLFKPYLEKVDAGAYVGVGSTQNFTLAAWAKVQCLYLVDFTQIVVLANKVHIALLRALATPTEYRSAFHPKQIKTTLGLLKSSFPAADYKRIARAYRVAQKFFYPHMKRMLRAAKKHGYQVYYSSDIMYSYVRGLANSSAIIAQRGNLMGGVTLVSLAAALTKAEVKVSVFYPSNAEDYPGLDSLPWAYKRNVRALPAAENSYALRTSSIFKRRRPWAPGSKVLTPKGFHYLVQPFGHFQGWLSIKGLTSSKMYDRAGTTDKKSGFTELNQSYRKKKK